jgi:hypothetical protein
VDASFVSGIGSIACICRDPEGKVIWARNDANIKCQDVAEAEAKACLFDLQSIQSVENAAIKLESYNAVVVDAIKIRDQGLGSGEFMRILNLFKMVVYVLKLSK